MSASNWDHRIALTKQAIIEEREQVRREKECLVLSQSKLRYFRRHLKDLQEAKAGRFKE